MELHQVSASEDEDDLEIVPQDQEDDTDMWDVENEDEDEIKQEKIRSERDCLHFHLAKWY